MWSAQNSLHCLVDKKFTNIRNARKKENGGKSYEAKIVYTARFADGGKGNTQRALKSGSSEQYLEHNVCFFLY